MHENRCFGNVRTKNKIEELKYETRSEANRRTKKRKKEKEKKRKKKDWVKEREIGDVFERLGSSHLGRGKPQTIWGVAATLAGTVWSLLCVRLSWCSCGLLRFALLSFSILYWFLRTYALVGAEEDLGLSHTDIGLVYSAYSLPNCVGGLFYGLAIDRWGTSM